MTFQIRGIPANLVEHFWQLAEPYVKRALDHSSGEFLPIDIKNFCKDRVVQLWMISENDKVIGAATTEIVNYPRRRHCRVITISGSRFKEWAGEFDIILCGWAKQQGCQAIEGYVRKGFVSVLNNYAFKHKYSAVFKDIQEN